MSVGNHRSASGTPGAVTGPAVGQKRRRELVDPEELTGKMREAMEADDFIIYGKASVEKYDDDNPPQKLEMEAFEPEVDGFHENGIISRRHKDIPVGEPLREHTLDEDTEVVVDDEVMTFEAGDTLRTGFEDDELWIVANIYNDSELARETRMGAMTGDLNGFSVTVFVKEWEETSKGQRVTELDWHSVTIGQDEMIKNEDSRFGVAEFKMFDALAGEIDGPAAGAAEKILRELPQNMSATGDDTDSKAFWSRVKDLASQKAGDEQDSPPADEKGDYEDEGDDYGDEDDYDDEDAMGGAAMMSDDAKAVLDTVREQVGEKEADTIVKEYEEMHEGPPEDDDEDYGEEEELKAENVAEKLSERFATKSEVEDLREKLDERPTADEVSEKLDDAVGDLPEDVATKQEVQDVIDTAEQVITDTLPEAQKAAAEETAQKMATGGTPDPSGGSANDARDYSEQIKDQFGTTGGN